MSSFTDRMIEDGFDDPEDYMRHLEGLNYNEFRSYNLEIYGDEIYGTNGISYAELKNNDKKKYKYYILPHNDGWNKVIIKSIGTLLIPRIFEKKYCYDNGYILHFCTYNFTEYHEATISISIRDIDEKEKKYFDDIISGDLIALDNASEYYRNKLFVHNSDNWKCFWDKIDIIEIGQKKCLRETYSIMEGKYGKLFSRNSYNFFLDHSQIEINTRYDLINGMRRNYDWKIELEKMIESFRIHGSN